VSRKEDLVELKKFLAENSINISKEFRSLSSDFNYVFYISNVDESNVKKLSIVLKNLCSDGEYIKQVEEDNQEEDGLKYLYDLLKSIYELPVVETKSKISKTEYYEVLKEASRMISSVTDFSQLTKILFKITKQLGYDKTIILFCDEDIFNFVDGYGINKDISGLYKMDLSVGEMMRGLGKIISRKQLLPEIINAQELFKIFPVGVIISLETDKEIEGFIILNDKESLEESFEGDCELLEIISYQISTVMKNFRLSKEAITDMLTGVYRYNYFIKRLNEEIYRSKLYKHPVSLLMLDLDNFKSINDTYGHQVGNVVLMEVAKILKENTRVSDTVCRYGGDEFAIIFPETNIYEAYKTAEILKEHINQVVKIANEIKDKIEKLNLNISIESITKETIEIKLTASMGYLL
jgi:diguanylate cyclase (GGDEF)-like protein